MSNPAVLSAWFSWRYFLFPALFYAQSDMLDFSYSVRSQTIMRAAQLPQSPRPQFRQGAHLDKWMRLHENLSTEELHRALQNAAAAASQSAHPAP
jgi:hypothetical protein